MAESSELDGQQTSLGSTDSPSPQLGNGYFTSDEEPEPSRASSGKSVLAAVLHERGLTPRLPRRGGERVVGSEGGDGGLQ